MTKVLLVENLTAVREILLKQLEMKDFDIIIAENGKKDVERAIAEKPDVILMNSGMPEMDGWGDPNIARRMQQTLTAKNLTDNRTAMGEVDCFSRLTL
jgi:CheY-like chemotaxis protein